MWALLFQYFIAGLIALSAGIVIALLMRINSVRRSSYVWINQLYMLFIAAVGCELIYDVLVKAPDRAPAQWLVQVLNISALCACALLCIPLERRITRSAGYDKLNAANRELEYNKQLLMTFMNNMPGMTYIQDDHDRIVYLNSKFADYFGVPLENMIGKKYSEWLPPDVAAKMAQQDRAVRSVGSKQKFIEEFALNGRNTTLVSTKFPLKGPKGESFVAGMSVEINEELQSKSMDAFLASIAQVSSDAIYSVDAADSRVSSWNLGAEQMFGYTAEEIIGAPIDILRPDYKRSTTQRSIEMLDEGKQVSDLETVRITKDGVHKPVLISAVKVKDYQERWHYVGIARDITEEKQAQIEIRRLHDETNNRLQSLSETNHALAAARDEALRVSNQTSALVANISHHLRTPLSGILGLTELALSEKVNNETLEMLHVVYESALALLTIVNDILDLSKLETGIITLEPQRFDPTALVNDCVKLTTPAMSTKGLLSEVVLDSKLPKMVIGDRGRIRQVLLNLLGNAVKFTASGTITTECEVLAESENSTTLRFAVTDSGIGMEPEESRTLFVPFSRLAKSARGISGTGLGLAISKQFVELMGGTIAVESETGKGSRFWFSIPLSKVLNAVMDDDLLQSVQLVTPMTAQSTQVLCVEDNPTLARLILQQLKHLGFPAESVATGHAAVEKAASGQFRIILMDIHLPDISGYITTQRIRAQERFSNSSKHIIIAMTASAMLDDREKALAVGMDDYLAKPVSLAQLKSTIYKQLANSSVSQTSAVLSSPDDA